jgi:hypothetical protein
MEVPELLVKEMPEALVNTRTRTHLAAEAGLVEPVAMLTTLDIIVVQAVLELPLFLSGHLQHLLEHPVIMPVGALVEFQLALHITQVVSLALVAQVVVVTEVLAALAEAQEPQIQGAGAVPVDMTEVQIVITQ